MVYSYMPFREREAADETVGISTEQVTLKRDLQNAKDQLACFIMIRGNPQGHRFFLTQKQMIIGRDPDIEMSISDAGISRKHSQITYENGQVILKDLNSSNGTFVNDKRIFPGEVIVLEKEDMIKLGNTILKFLPAGAIEILFYGNLDLAAHTDPLTHAYNKGYLLEALEAEFKRAKALHTDLSLIFFDLDHFKRINDQYGHDAGDYVLKEVASIVRASDLKSKDIFARYGGEEFVLLLASTDKQAAVLKAEAIRLAIETHLFIYEGKRFSVTVTMGVDELRWGVESALTLLKSADKALYLGKTNGRNQVIAASD